MKKNLTELVFILDKSGSMSGFLTMKRKLFMTGLKQKMWEL